MPDGLDLYTGDYRGTGTAGQTVATVYQVGRGLLEDASPPEEKTPTSAAGSPKSLETAEKPTVRPVEQPESDKS
jgi:hypothetical protein